MVSIPGPPSEISKAVIRRYQKPLGIGLASSALALLASVMVAGESSQSRVISFIPPQQPSQPSRGELAVVDLSKPRDPRDPPVPLIDSRLVASTGVGTEELALLDLSLETGLATVPDSVTMLDLSTVPDLPVVPSVPDLPSVPLELVAIDLSTIPDMPMLPAAGTENVSTWATTEVDSQGQSVNETSSQPGVAMAGTEPPRASEWLQGIKQPLLRYATQQRLSLFEALMQAISYAPEIDVVRTELGIREQEIQRQQGAFNWTQFVETNWDELNQPVASALDGVAQRLEQHTLNSTGGVRKLNAVGGQASLSQDLGFRDSNSSFFTPNNQALTRIALEYRQPLLRGAGRSANLGQIQIATTDANISYEQMVGTIQRHLGQVAQAYWELVRLRGNYAIQLQNNRRILHIAEILRNRQDLDIGPVRLARIEGAVTSSQAELLRAEYAVVGAQDQLLRLIYGSCFMQNANIETIPDIELEGAASPLDQEYHIQLALQNRPEVLQAIQGIRRASVQHGIAKNQLLPLLGLTLSLSNRGTVGDRLLGSAISDQFSIGDPTYGIGLAYERPYRNQAAKAGLQQTRLRLVQLQRQFEQTVADVVVDMRGALREVELSDQRRQLTEQTMQLTYRELVAQEQRMQLLLDGEQVGVLYLENLLQTQFRATSSSQEYLDATVGFFNAYFQLQRSNGTLVRNENPSVK